MKLELMGLGINTETPEQLLQILSERLRDNKKTFITTPYSEFYYYAASDWAFKKAVNAADISLADGISVIWLAHFLELPFKAQSYYGRVLEGFWQLAYTNLQLLFAPGKINGPIKQRIQGSVFFWDLAKFAKANNLKIFLLGGFGKTPAVVKNKLIARFPGIEIVGYSNSGPKDPGLVDQINRSGADLLFVAFGPVTQEKWIYNNLNSLQVKIAMGVGGTFDYVSGERSAPPPFMRRVGLEWLYRLITQPKRIIRIYRATVLFLLGSLRHKVFMSMPYRENAAGIIINKENKVFIATRILENPSELQTREHWQFPQGGIDRGEDPDHAALREIREETGISNVTILGKASEHYSYIWNHFKRRLIGGRGHRGQRQTIYYLRFTGSDSEIKLDQSELQEYKWISIEQLKDYIHPIRQDMLKIVLSDINKFI